MPVRLKLQASDLMPASSSLLLAPSRRPCIFQERNTLITGTQFLELQQLPSEIVFVGGGYIAMEFAHVAARAGARPSVLHRGERVLERFDPDLVSKLTTHSQELGIVLHTQTTVEAIEK